MTDMNLETGYTKVCNNPQPTTTIHNHPQPSTTTHIHLQPQKGYKNDKKRINFNFRSKGLFICSSQYGSHWLLFNAL